MGCGGQAGKSAGLRLLPALLFIAALLWTSAAWADEPVRLFNTVEFRGALKNLPKWDRVLGAERKDPTFKSDAVGKVKWQALKDRAEGLSLKEKLKQVNDLFNRMPYRTDMEVWGVEDYWETPREFIHKSGDCEDYAITKYYALRDLGLPASDLRIVILQDTIRNLAHAVLVVYGDGTAYVLDNVSNVIMTHDRLGHYKPQYSVNEEYRWSHVPIKNKN